MKQSQYVYLKDEDEEYWMELDEGNYAIRQIIRDSKGVFRLSCFEDCLAEEPILDLTYFAVISYDDFQNIWNSILYENKAEWENIKKTYKLGSYAKFRVEYFYPQGAILKNNNVIAICKGNCNFDLHENISLQVIQYDDENHWIVVE